MSPISKIFYLILPVILAGITNMIFIKVPILNTFKIPIDNGILLSDGKRIFGDHKTWKGFFGMIVFTSFWFVFFMVLAKGSKFCANLSLIPYKQFSFIQGMIAGALWGFGYVLFELPNSYIKRRINIQPGKTGKGFIGILFSFFDQADSVLGCLAMLLIFYFPSTQDIIAIFALSVIVHYIMNIVLYLLKLKSQPL
ncbi:MAG: CDP-archaeol synthase [Desulfobacterales bacterium]|nr:CDP-archaeol synthase [Desulfobacterales bacterium]